jgi:anti-sigma B factor antagonist
VIKQKPTIPTFDLKQSQFGAVWVLELAGELDMDSAPRLETTFLALRSEDCFCLIIDLHRLSFMDSFGLHMILKEALWAGEHGRAFRLRSPQPRVRLVFDLTGVSDRVDWVRSGELRATEIGQSKEGDPF